jgi:hypothetical protein
VIGPFDKLRPFDRLTVIGPFDKLRPFDRLTVIGPFDKLRANGGGHAPTALRICSSTSFALAGIGVPGP